MSQKVYEVSHVGGVSSLWPEGFVEVFRVKEERISNG